LVPPNILIYGEIDKPIPGSEEVLIKLCAAAVNPLDWKLMKGGPFIVRLLLGLCKPKPKGPGVDVAGQVEAVGRNVTQFKPGDEVFGTCHGAFAECLKWLPAGELVSLQSLKLRGTGPTIGTVT